MQKTHNLNKTLWGFPRAYTYTPIVVYVYNRKGKGIYIIRLRRIIYVVDDVKTTSDFDFHFQKKKRRLEKKQAQLCEQQNRAKFKT